MHIQQINVRNFRLLTDVELQLEKDTTLIVGRNNSGKTSLSEVVRRFLSEDGPRFQLEDFSSSCCESFCSALKAMNEGDDDEAIRNLIPYIELQMTFRYDPSDAQLGALGDFIIDLDPDCHEAIAIIRYELRDGAISTFLDGLPTGDLTPEVQATLFRTLRDRIPSFFNTSVWAQDPTDTENRRQLKHADLRSLARAGFVNAQRGLDDITSRDTDVLARVLEGLFATATSPTAATNDQQIAIALQEAVKEIQQKLDNDFSDNLNNLLPTLAIFGYPGLGGSALYTETILDVKRLLSNHTRVRYAGYEGISLPESYNGLGSRNLIFILLQLVGFYKNYRAEAFSPAVHLVFIEEPEAHLHPQMQEVFIRQLERLSAQLNDDHPSAPPWPVQFVVSTHSSHIANEVGFEKIRYFLARTDGQHLHSRHTVIKDLRNGLGPTPANVRSFVSQYLTLTRCDLFFADKAILVEGTTERLLLPAIIGQIEKMTPLMPKLSSQYITTMEVGGAYAHLFFGLLDFLELQSLIVTDIDSINSATRKACPVHQGDTTSNACLQAWFTPKCTISELLKKSESEMINSHRRIAFQCPETENGPCGRSFEDAFMLANPCQFGMTDKNHSQCEIEAFESAKQIKKSQFALDYAINKTNWIAPRYIVEGLIWLAGGIIEGNSPHKPFAFPQSSIVTSNEEALQ